MVKRSKKKTGWFGQSKRHSEASVKGWNSRFGKKKVSLKDVKKIHAKRSNRAKSVDNLKSAKVVGKNRYAQWAGNPARFDVKGVDTIAGSKKPQRRFLNSFLKEVDYKNAKKEFGHVIIDSKLEKVSGNNNVIGLSNVIDNFTADKIETIHNHPFECPPSSQDIFALLYSGSQKKSQVVLPSGKVYVMEKTKNTRPLTNLSSKKVKEFISEKGKTNALIEQLNKDMKSEKRRFMTSYNQFEQIYADQLKEKYNIGSTKELNKQPKYVRKVQEKTLDKMAELHGFKVKKIRA